MRSENQKKSIWFLRRAIQKFECKKMKIKKKNIFSSFILIVNIFYERTFIASDIQQSEWTLSNKNDLFSRWLWFSVDFNFTLNWANWAIENKKEQTNKLIMRTLIDRFNWNEKRIRNKSLELIDSLSDSNCRLFQGLRITVWVWHQI